ncbi:MAG: peptidylprolyl isomerase [Roseovarius sp.]
MSRERLIVAALAVLGLGLVGFQYLGATRPVPASESASESAAAAAKRDAPGPYLVIEIAGEANGTVRIDLDEEAAPRHAERLITLARRGDYDNVVFHRVIAGFMAQTGDVRHGKLGADLRLAGTGGSDLPDLKAEFSELPFVRGVVGMARARNPDSANSQFFIMFAPAPHLDGKYTVVGRVVEGMQVVDAIKRGTGPNGAVTGAPDVMTRVRVEQ